MPERTYPNPSTAPWPGCVIASDGAMLPIESLPQAYTYDETGGFSIDVTFNGVVYRQTYTSTAGKLTGISGWERQ